MKPLLSVYLVVGDKDVEASTKTIGGRVMGKERIERTFQNKLLRGEKALYSISYGW